MSEQSLTVQNNDTAVMSPEMLAAMGMSEQGTPSFDKPSRLVLVHKDKPKDGQHAGTYFDPAAKTTIESMDVILLDGYRGKVLYEEDSEFGSKPLCRAKSTKLRGPKVAMFPILDNPDLVVPPSGRKKGCKGCEKNQWKVVGKKKIKPQCADTRSLLVMDVATGIPYRISYKRSGVSPVEDFNDTLDKYLAVAKAKLNMTLTPLHVRFTIGVNSLSTKKGDYSVPDFSNIVGASRDETLQAIELFKKFVMKAQPDQDEEEDAAEEALTDALRAGSQDNDEPPFDTDEEENY